MAEAERGIRLHKFLARSGIASKRDCEDLIRAGRVTVDGLAVTTMGAQVDPETQDIRFDGERVQPQRPLYFLVYKPAGVVCTSNDQFGRPSVVDLVRTRNPQRLFSVGRLEEDSEGLILVTNDGIFAHQVLKGGPPLRQTWFLRARGKLSMDGIKQVREGVWLSDGRTSSMWVKPLHLGKKVSTVLVSPSAYQHRHLRRAFGKVGVHVNKVVRIRLGPLDTKGLKKGGYRPLAPEEIHALLNPSADDIGMGSLSTHSRERSRSRVASKRAGRHKLRERSVARRSYGKSGGRPRRDRASEGPPEDSSRRIIGP